MAKAVQRLYEIGAEAKRKVGEATDHKVLEGIKENLGISLYDLAEELGWSRGKVGGSVNRLLKKGHIKTVTLLRKGKLVKRLYPSTHTNPRVGTVRIPLKMIDQNLWKERAFIYGVSHSSIVIRPERYEKLVSAPLKGDSNIVHGDEEITIFLPESFIAFYGLWNSELGLSTSEKGDSIHLTLEATVIPLSSEEESSWEKWAWYYGYKEGEKPSGR